MHPTGQNAKTMLVVKMTSRERGELDRMKQVSAATASNLVRMGLHLMRLYLDVLACGGRMEITKKGGIPTQVWLPVSEGPREDAPAWSEIEHQGQIVLEKEDA